MSEDSSLCYAWYFSVTTFCSIVSRVSQRLRRKVCFQSRDSGAENTKESDQPYGWYRKHEGDREMERRIKEKRARFSLRLTMRRNERRWTWPKEANKSVAKRISSIGTDTPSSIASCNYQKNTSFFLIHCRFLYELTGPFLDETFHKLELNEDASILVAFSPFTCKYDIVYF